MIPKFNYKKCWSILQNHFDMVTPLWNALQYKYDKYIFIKVVTWELTRYRCSLSLYIVLSQGLV